VHSFNCIPALVDMRLQFYLCVQVNSVLLCRLRRNVQAFCHKQDSLMRGVAGAAAFVDSGKRTRHKCYNLYFTVEVFMTRNGPAAAIDAKARYWSRISIFAYPSCILRFRWAILPLLATMAVSLAVFLRYSASKNSVTLKTGLGVVQDH